MRIPKMVLAAAIVLAGVPAGAGSSLDGYPARIRYLSNEAPFVVFGVTPARLAGPASALTLTFIATEPLQQVHVFPFVRATRGGAARMAAHVACGPKDAGSWDCVVPTGDLLQWLAGSEGEFGLRIEAHGDPHEPDRHSTVLVTVPVERGAERLSPARPRPPPAAPLPAPRTLTYLRCAIGCGAGSGP